MITIYSKDGCRACRKAIAYVEDNNLPYEIKKIGVDVSVDEIKLQYEGVKTVPVVVVDGEWIGGFEDLERRFG